MSRVLIISALFALTLSGCGRDTLDVGGAAAATAGDGSVASDGAPADGGVFLDAAGGSDAMSSDAFLPDATPVDATPPDTGSRDAQPPPDTGLRDAQPTDAIPGDATPPDVGFRDAQPTDAIPGDATPPDVGFRDAQPTDAIPGDATPPDVGFRDAQPTDALPGDATPPDVGFRDAQPTDAIPGDATPPDVGFRDAQPGDALPADALQADGGPIDGGTPCALGCSALDDACNVGVCGPDGVTCVARPRADGTSCSDSNACTTPDLCLLGRCIPGLERDCSALSGACVVGACNPGTGQCEAIPQTPAGDSCAAPIPLTVLPGEQVQGGNTTCAADDVLLECGAGGGRDLVYSATFVETRRIQLTLSNPPMSPATPRGLQVHAGMCGLPPSLMCEAASAGAVAIDEVFAGGTYYFVVDEGAVPPVADHELLIHVDPHDTCADPSIIDVPLVGATNTYRGNTRNNVNDFAANCGNASSADQVYRMVVAQPSTLRLEMVPPGNGQPQFDTVLHVRSSTCAASVTPLFCDDDSGAGSLSLIERSFAAGTYFVVVDGFGSNQQGEYRLDVTQVPPLTTLVFPDVGDARQPLAGPFATAGQFVEGIRNVALTTARRVQVDLMVINGLTCGQALFRVRLNNIDFGTFVVRPGLTMLSQSFTSATGVNSVNGRFNIRYELVNAPPMGCGVVELPDGVSTVGLGP
jgi:hypothetical protein